MESCEERRRELLPLLPVDMVSLLLPERSRLVLPTYHSRGTVCVIEDSDSRYVDPDRVDPDRVDPDPKLNNTVQCGSVKDEFL